MSSKHTVKIIESATQPFRSLKTPGGLAIIQNQSGPFHWWIKLTRRQNHWEKCYMRHFVKTESHHSNDRIFPVGKRENASKNINEMAQGPCAPLGFKCWDMGIVAWAMTNVVLDD
jgi:hypothetical protein